MGYTSFEIEHTESNLNNLINKKRVTFNIISDWYDRSIKKEIKLNQVIGDLMKILRKCDCGEALLQLQAFAKKQTKNNNCSMKCEKNC